MGQISTVDAIFNPETQQAALKFCDSALKTGILPSSIKTPQQALIILLKGQEIGMGAIEALTNIHVVKGKAELSAVAMSARLLRGGVSIETIESTDVACRLRLSRVISGRETVIETSFSEEDAKRAALWGKDNWLKYPQDMLYARALSRGARRIGADLIGGCYVQGEISEAPTESPAMREVVDTMPQGDEVAAVTSNDDAFNELKDRIATTTDLRELKKMSPEIDALGPNQIDSALMAWAAKRDELESGESQ